MGTQPRVSVPTSMTDSETTSETRHQEVGTSTVSDEGSLAETTGPIVVENADHASVVGDNSADKETSTRLNLRGTDAEPETEPSIGLAPDVGESWSTVPEDSTGRLMQAIMLETGVGEALADCISHKVLTGEEIMDAFHGDSKWLAAVVRTQDLMAEIEGGANHLARIAVSEWHLNGTSQQLIEFADGLLDQGKCRCEAEAQVRLEIASALSILRPERAQQLLESALPMLEETASNQKLVEEVRPWVQAGSLLNRTAAIDRKFWDRRLRNCDEAWDWGGVESRLALNNLAKLIGNQTDRAALFQKVVPGCWWDLLVSRAADSGGKGESVAVRRHAVKTAGCRFFIGGAVFGLLLSAGGAILALKLFNSGQVGGENPVGGDSDAAKSLAIRPDGASVPEQPIVPLVKSPAPNAQTSLMEALSQNGGEQNQEPAPSTLQPPEIVAASPQIVDPHAATLQAMDWRKNWVTQIRRNFGSIERLHSLIHDGSLKSGEAPMRGASSMAPFGSPAHLALLEWLMIDPPKDADVRRAAQRIYMQSAPRGEVVAMLHRLADSSNPYCGELQECAQLLLDSATRDMPQSEREQLAAVVAIKR